jgi:hypothetical protein
LRIVARLRAIVQGENLGADLVVTSPQALPSGMTGTMTLRDTAGATLADPAPLDGELRWRVLPGSAGVAEVDLEISLEQGALTYADPFASAAGPDPDPDYQSVGPVSVSLEQVRPAPAGGDAP